jgi:hypothetical protein
MLELNACNDDVAFCNELMFALLEEVYDKIEDENEFNAETLVSFDDV